MKYGQERKKRFKSKLKKTQKRKHTIGEQEKVNKTRVLLRRIGNEKRQKISKRNYKHCLRV